VDEMKIKGRSISPGIGKGKVLISKEPIGFYGNVDPKTGIVIEKGHELEGKCIKDKVLVFPHGKGSTVGSYVIYGLKKNGVAPAALVNRETETIVATGAILAGIPCIDKLEKDPLEVLKDGDEVIVDGDKGLVEFETRNR
jgi:predicted aconitase with swiveling domain